MATIRITDLHLRTFIGINDWEREVKQDVVINISIDYDATKASKSDDINDAIDYKAITKAIISEVEGSAYYLLEKLADMVMAIVMENKKVKKAIVRIDKPEALRFAKSVSVELTKSK